MVYDRDYDYFSLDDNLWGVNKWWNNKSKSK